MHVSLKPPPLSHRVRRLFNRQTLSWNIDLEKKKCPAPVSCWMCSESIENKPNIKFLWRPPIKVPVSWQNFPPLQPQTPISPPASTACIINHCCVPIPYQVPIVYSIYATVCAPAGHITQEDRHQSDWDIGTGLALRFNDCLTFFSCWKESNVFIFFAQCIMGEQCTRTKKTNCFLLCIPYMHTLWVHPQLKHYEFNTSVLCNFLRSQLSFPVC